MSDDRHPSDHDLYDAAEGLTATAGQFVDGDGDGTPSVRWADLMMTIATGIIIWITGLWTAFIGAAWEWLTILVTGVIDRAVALAEWPFTANQWLIAESWTTAGQSFDGQFGIFAFIVGAVLVVLWFIGLESLLAFFRGWLS